MTDIATGTTIFGVIGLVAGILMLIGGILLLVFGIISTVKGKKRIGRIVGGGILVFVGLQFAIMFGMFSILGGATLAMPQSDNYVEIGEDFEEVFEDNDPHALMAYFAEDGYSGPALDLYEADKVFACFESDIKSVDVQVEGITMKNGTYNVQYVLTIKTEDGEKYKVTVDYITASPDEDYIGIQHIRVKGGGKTLCEVGEEPDLD
jgi:hypothetical protein